MSGPVSVLTTLLLRVLANGTLWLVLGGLVFTLAAADAAGAFDRRPRVARAAGFVFALACAAGGLCGTPVPWPLAAVLVPLSLTHVLRGFQHPNRRARVVLAILFGTSVAAAL